MRLVALLCVLCLLLTPPLGLWYAVTTFGTPHLVYRYKFYDNGRRHDPLAKREYISCTYWGYAGTFTVRADAGHCPWVRFFKKRSR